MGDFSKILFFPPLVDIYRHPLLRVHRTSQKIPRKDLQKEMNEEFELITVTISLAATAMNENNCRTATGKPAFSAVMQSMSRHVILPRAFGKEGRNSSMLCAKTFMKKKTSFGMYLLQGRCALLLFYLLFIMIVFQVQNVHL